jgi:hypothetical protein
VRLYADTNLVHNLLVHGHKHISLNQHHHYPLDVVLNKHNLYNGYNDFDIMELHEYDLDHPNDHIILNVLHGDADEHQHESIHGSDNNHYIVHVH